MNKRYDMKAEYNPIACEDQVKFTECADGNWVKFEDIEALQTERDALAVQNSAMRKQLEFFVSDQFEWNDSGDPTIDDIHALLAKTPQVHYADFAKLSFSKGYNSGYIDGYNKLGSQRDSESEHYVKTLGDDE